MHACTIMHVLYMYCTCVRVVKNAFPPIFDVCWVFLDAASPSCLESVLSHEEVLPEYHW